MSLHLFKDWVLQQKLRRALGHNRLCGGVWEYKGIEQLCPIKLGFRRIEVLAPFLSWEDCLTRGCLLIRVWSFKMRWRGKVKAVVMDLFSGIRRYPRLLTLEILFVDEKVRSFRF